VHARRLEQAASCCSSDTSKSPERTKVDQAGNEWKEICSNGTVGPSGDESGDLGTKTCVPGEGSSAVLSFCSIGKGRGMDLCCILHREE